MPDDERQVGHGRLVEVLAGWPQLVVHGLAISEEGEAGDRLELALVAQRLDQLEHEFVATLAARHVGGVLQALVGPDGHVRPADDHRDAGGPELVGHRVGGRRGGGGRREADEVRAQHVVPVDRSEHLAVDADVVTGGGHGGADHGEAEPRVLPRGHEVHARRFGLDEADLHPVLSG